MAPSGIAPSYVVPQREIVAVEHPMIVKNIDNGLKTFGTAIPLKQVGTAKTFEGNCSCLSSFTLYSKNLLS